MFVCSRVLLWFSLAAFIKIILSSVQVDGLFSVEVDGVARLVADSFAVREFSGL
jgi:hypothetical protein